MTLDDFLPYILPFAKGCSVPIANLNTRLALIEFCRESLIWRAYQTDIPTVTGQTAYTYAPAAGQMVVELLELRIMDAAPATSSSKIDVIDPASGKIRDDRGDLSPYAYGTLGGFELRPAVATGPSIRTYSAVAPTLTATTVPDALAQYSEDIAQGSLSRILSTKDREYSDPTGAIRYQQSWKAALGKAKNDALRGNARATVRTGKVWM